MVCRNLIFVRETLLFITYTPNKNENVTKIEKKIGNNMLSSTDNESSINPSVVAHCQSTPAHSYITGIYRNNFNINISFKPLYLSRVMYPLIAAEMFMPILSNIRFSCTPYDTSYSIKQE